MKVKQKDKLKRCLKKTSEINFNNHLKPVNKLTTVCNLKVWNTWHLFVLQFHPSFPEVLLVQTA